MQDLHRLIFAVLIALSVALAAHAQSPPSKIASTSPVPIEKVPGSFLQ